MQLQNQIRRLASFSSAAADGKINPNEISSLGIDLFGDGLDFMGYGHEAATQVAQEQTDFYYNAYGTITQEQYYNNPAIAQQASLYFNEDGDLNTDAMFNEFYEEALKEYAEQEILPRVNELEKQIEQEKTEEETLLETEEAELQALGQSISSQIQSTAPKYP